MIDDTLRRELVTALSQHPLVSADPGQAGRTALLAGLPAVMNRNASNAGGDITLIVMQLEDNYGPNGEWRLLLLIDNALTHTRGTTLGAELRRIRDALAQARPRSVGPHDLFQVHTFDLRRPVLTCIGLLPAAPTLSGFAITTTTSDLLKYFCDGLKHRGEANFAWSRRDVTVKGPPAVIDPRHTTADVVLAATDRIRDFLGTKHLVWPMYVEDADDAHAIWRGLVDQFGGPFAHHFVVVFGLPPGTAPPPGMHTLPAPQFTALDVREWVTSIGTTLTWNRPVIDRWIGAILQGVPGDPADLPARRVYEVLMFHLDLVKEHRTPDELMVALDELAIGES